MKNIILLLAMTLFSAVLFAQQAVTVKVYEAKTGAPLPNASVKIKNSGKGGITNSEGVYQLQAPSNAVLEISSVGYATVTLSLNGEAEVSVRLEATTVEIGDVVIVGTRGAPRARTETPIPIDVIKINQAGMPTAKMDLTSVLNTAAPSFNYNKQTGADGADHIDLGTLRGLGPDQTLVLINGKRRHQTAFVALFGTRGRGNSGVDLNAFPEAAVDRIEILRDGASAQYGSDAMAGVINIILKKDVNRWAVNAGWSGYYDHKYNTRKFNAGNQYYSGNAIDGNTFTLSVNNGARIGRNGGFLNVSLDVLTQGKTYRQADTANWQTKKDALPYINTSRRAFGDESLTTGGIMYNMEVPSSTKYGVTFYSFGGYNYKASDAFAYTRNYSARPDRFPANQDGTLINVPDILRTANDGEIYFNPHIQTHIQDASLALGIKGTTVKNWNWDLSNTLGRNDFHFFGDKTFNASRIGQGSPNHYDDGGFNFLQSTLNLDVSKSFRSIAQGLNLGLGAEYRYERYEIYKGEEGSYMNYHPGNFYYANIMDSAAPASGSQGFPGFSPSDVVKANRSNIGAYVDAELNVTREWLVDGAVRFEDYSDFGSVATVKLATRYKVTPDFNLRGSVSTGYRAPSLQQINFSNTLTSFSGGQLVQSRIASNNDPITRAAGIPKLKEEKSVNGSLGFSWKATRGLTITLDGYMVKVKNRIVLSGLFSRDDATLPPSFTSQIPAEVSTVQFFDNAVNTTNYGLDIIADYSRKWGNQSFSALLAGNLQHMTIDAVHVPEALKGTVLNQKTFFSDREEAFLLASAPKEKMALSLEYHINKFGLGTHITYYGKIVLLGFGDATADNPNQTGINPMVPSDANPNVYVPERFNFDGKVVTDLFASYKFSHKISLFAGADNLFNVHPDIGVNPLAKGWFGDNESGGPWDSVQMGFNGMRLFTKLAFEFGK